MDRHELGQAKGMGVVVLEGCGAVSAHDEDKQLICPHCLKRFETRQAVKTHQKAKRHTQFHNVPVPWAKYAPDTSHETQ